MTRICAAAALACYFFAGTDHPHALTFALAGPAFAFFALLFALRHLTKRKTTA